MVPANGVSLCRFYGFFLFVCFCWLVRVFVHLLLFYLLNLIFPFACLLEYLLVSLLDCYFACLSVYLFVLLASLPTCLFSRSVFIFICLYVCLLICLFALFLVCLLYLVV